MICETNGWMLEKGLEGGKVAKKIRICLENGWMLGWCLFEGQYRIPEEGRKLWAFSYFS